MKKIGNKSYNDFPPTVFYLDELEEIIDFFKKHTGGVSIETKEVILESDSELKELEKHYPHGRVPELKIRSSNPYISLDIKGYELSVYISEENPISLAAIQKIREVSVKNKRIAFKYVTQFLPLIFVLPISPLFMDGYKIEAAGFLFTSILLSFLTIKNQMKNSMKIYVRNKSELSSFFTRKKEDIYVALISAVAGSILTIVITKMFSNAA